MPRLQRLAPTTAIRGNVGRGSWADRYPPDARVTLAGRAISLLHDIAALDVDPAAAGLAMVVYGHSHRPGVAVRDGVVFLNPGSAGPRRFRLPVTLATVDLGATPLEPMIHTLVA